MYGGNPESQLQQDDGPQHIADCESTSSNAFSLLTANRHLGSSTVDGGSSSEGCCRRDREYRTLALGRINRLDIRLAALMSRI